MMVTRMTNGQKTVLYSFILGDFGFNYFWNTITDNHIPKKLS